MTSRALSSLLVGGIAVVAAAVSTVHAEPSPPFEPAERIGNATSVGSDPSTTTTPSTPTTPTTNPSTPPTTTATTPTTNPSTNPSVEGAEGHVGLFVPAKKAFDPYTKPLDSGTWASLRANYDAMMVFAPYFDRRIGLFEDHYVYIDLYGLDVTSDEGPAEGHLDWVLETAGGGKVYIPFACGNGCPQYAADVGNPAFQDSFVADIGALVARGYGGVMIDDVNMLRRFSDRNGSSVAPMNPRTGEPMTLSEWRQSVAELLERVRAEFPDIEIMHNAVWFADTPGLSSPYVDKQIAAADLIYVERGANDLGLTGGNGNYSYAKFIAQLERVHRLGANVALIDNTAETITEQRFNLATALLVSNGGDFVGTENLDHIAPGSIWPGFGVDLGPAAGPHSHADGVWRREFHGGIVVVNEPQRATRTISLGGTYIDESGRRVTSVTLRSREAVILVRA